ncbi:crossover junction endodeoxyribonuclease RuvC [Flexistipes sp.]|uniref:crossover junction endodeoxyribonuclease RuvC n=1 Tax=Flexistipes sp. TaxID=3088135 RepID=UPI002E24B11A|nr:crossover junction endodeoxyribonuclease RuvC [Flexistipes sp.]
MIIFGIDPGLNNTGIGILDVYEKKISYNSHYVIKTNAKNSLPERLKTICSSLQNLYTEYKPEYAAVEDIFYSVNVKSAILLGQTRGAIIATLLGCNVEMFEFTALQIKKSVVGYGKADKHQVKKLVELHLGKTFDKKIPLDATDALACGICLGLSLTGKYNVL